MFSRKITGMYFSPTGTTKKVVSGIAKRISENINCDSSFNIVDFTLPKGRQEPATFSEGDVVVFGVPVYAGRVPNLLLKYLSSITGNGALAVAVVVFGHREYEDSLIELTDILSSKGFKVIGGGAFIGEHSLSKTLAQGRPDEKDMVIVNEFADKLSKKLSSQDKVETAAVKGERPYRKYYTPVKQNGEPLDIRKVKPKTNSNCINCKLCANICPMGSIDYEDVADIKGVCIKCGACIKNCPTQAKYYDDEDFIIHIREIEDGYASPRREPELFV